MPDAIDGCLCNELKGLCWICKSNFQPGLVFSGCLNSHHTTLEQNLTRDLISKIRAALLRACLQAGWLGIAYMQIGDCTQAGWIL